MTTSNSPRNQSKFNQQSQHVDNQTNVAGDLNIYGTDHIDPKAALIAYLETLSQRCHVLPLAAIGGDASTSDQVQLDQVYVDLDTTSRVPLVDEETDEGKANQKERALSRGEDDRPLPALEAATQEQKLVLLGDPGAGKSTFVRQLTAWLADAYLGVREGPLGWRKQTTPLFVVLRDLAPRLQALALSKMQAPERKAALVDAIRNQWQAELSSHHGEGCLGLVDGALQRGEVLLVFDGLDETPDANREWIRDALAALLERYPCIQHLVVTCRVRSYVGNTELPGFSAHTLAPFDRAHIQNFVAGWYGAQAKLGRLTVEHAEARREDLTSAALSSALAELSTNPMLLTTMAMIHQQEVGLPKDRVHLYQLAVDVLLSRWQRHKGIEVEPALGRLLDDTRRIRRILERLAHVSHQREADSMGDLTRGEALTLLEEPANLNDITLAAQFLDYVDRRAGILVGEGGNPNANRPQTYRFPHRTFQEYLAACQLVEGRNLTRTFRTLAEAGNFWYVAAQLGAEELLINRRNQNGLLDLMYGLCPENAPQSERDWRTVVWSGQMAKLVSKNAIRADSEPDGGENYLRRLTGRLVELLSQDILTPRERADAGIVLGYLDDPRPGVGLKNGLPDIEWIEIQAGPFLMGNTKETDPDAYKDEMPQFTCTLIQKPYRISRYPITVAQYQAFVDAGGYDQEKFWTHAGWRWRQEKNISGPARYRDIYVPNHPQVSISWYESMAFCAWLTEATGQTVRLPTEAEWERAARHTDGRIYPWDGDFSPTHCNMSDTGIGTTCAVGIFVNGDAECGAADMAGNVLEWCSTQWRSDYTDYENQVNERTGGTDSRVLRGGSFRLSRYGVRCAVRSHFEPLSRRFEHMGMRVMSPGL